MVDAEGKPLGVLATDEAIRIARERGQDLVEVAPNAKPPVARIMDYGAYRYRQQKQAAQQKKHAKKVEIKGVRIGMRISEHDFAHKVDQTRRFLGEGHRIKLELVMRGREQAFQLRSRAYERLDKFVAALEVPIVRESDPTKVGNRLTVLLAAGKAKKPEPSTPTATKPTDPNAKA